MLTKNDISQISNLMDNKLKPIKQDLKTIKKDQSSMLKLLDQEQMSQRKRITRLEERVGISNPQ